MRSQLRHFMDLADEQDFFQAALEQPTTALIHGPEWDTREPPLVDPAALPSEAWYLYIWDRVEVPKLRTRRTETGWEVVNPGETIQYLRSQLWDGNVLCEGRIAIATDGGAAMVERRYKRLRAFIRRSFRNNVVGWTNPSLAAAAKVRPDPSVWVGPGALQWLQGGGTRKFKQSPQDRTEAVFCGKGGDQT